MTTLRLSVQLLTGVFHGRADDDTAEWPPSPFRLFQAMVAGCRTGSARAAWTDARQAAFEWLERQPPPMIVAPDAHRARPLRLAVPNNDMDVVAREWARGKFDPMAPAKLRTFKDLQPQVLDDGVEPVVHYVWPLVSDDDHPAREIAQASRHLLAFGLGVDLAAAHARVGDGQDDELVGRRWRPTKAGVSGLRVPVVGSLQSLDRRHAAFVARIQGRTMNLAMPGALHETVTYGAAGAMLMRPCVGFHLVDASGRMRAVTDRAIHVLSGMARHAAIEAATRDGRPERWIAGFVAGHGSGEDRPDRFAYLPVPSIGHRHVDGWVRRLLIATPPGGDVADAAWAASRIDGAPLVDESTGEVVATLSRVPTPDDVFKRYCDPARRWTSATPVVLPGHDDKRREKTEGLFERALEQAGVADAVADYELRREPFWPGTRHARDYQVPPYLRGFGRWHAAITLRVASLGPVTIGAGRHLGLGIFANRPE